MSDSLGTYLHDHMAGALHAVNLLEVLRDRYDGQELGSFASGLLVEIKADRETLREIADRVGVGASELKELAAWMAEKMGRLKMRRDEGNGLGTFEALEFLELGVHGKWALWRALGAVSEKDERLKGVDYAHLASRAEAQRNTIEERRLDIAREALSNGG
jgi:hypothetical protein